VAAATWRCPTFVRWTGWTLAVTLSRWQHRIVPFLSCNIYGEATLARFIVDRSSVEALNNLNPMYFYRCVQGSLFTSCCAIVLSLHLLVFLSSFSLFHIAKVTWFFCKDIMALTEFVARLRIVRYLISLGRHYVPSSYTSQGAYNS